jgi:hypothetical protein
MCHKYTRHQILILLIRYNIIIHHRYQHRRVLYDDHEFDKFHHHLRLI